MRGIGVLIGMKDRSLKNIPLLGAPASLAFGYEPLQKRGTSGVLLTNDKVWLCIHDLCCGRLRLRQEGARRSNSAPNPCPSYVQYFQLIPNCFLYILPS